MFKKLLTFFFIIISIWLSIWSDNDYYEYAEIPNTDIIEFNANINSNIYKVYINTWTIEYITWSDNKLHNCFPIVWTWYTEKLWEIYFQYQDKGSYICSDNKLRWVFKIWAWWWWYMEDLENKPEIWKNYQDENDYNWSYYHSEDANANWTWQAWLEWIGFANWNNVRTKLNIQKAFSDINIQSIFNGWAIANWLNTWSLTIIVMHKNGKSMKNFKVDSIEFITWYNSDIKKNWNTIPWYKYNGPLITDSNWQIKWEAISYVWWSKNYWIKLKIQDNEIIKEWNVQFTYPFNLKFTIQENNTRNKKLIWEDNMWKIEVEDEKVSNLSFSNISSIINLNWNENYFNIEDWNNIWINTDWNIKIKPNHAWWYYKNDELEISYNITWDYEYTIWSDVYYINWFNKNTNTEKIYKDGLVNYINISKSTANISKADWKSILWYDLRFYDKDNYPINNLTFDFTNFQDPDNSFDLDSSTSWYEKWFFLTWDNSSSNVNWTYRIWIISYKPVFNSYLSWYIENINYSWYYSFSNEGWNIIMNNIHFSNPVWISFEDKILNANENDDFTVSYNKSISNISHPSYNFTWYISWCSDCSLETWKNITDNNFQEKTHNIYISWTTAPSAVVYTWYYSYDLSWSYWKKTIKNYFKKEYSPIIYINKWNVNIVWIAASNSKILWWVDYISTSVEPYIMKNEIKKHVLSQTNGIKANILSDNENINVQDIAEKQNVYKCNNNEVINIWWNYDKDIEIILLWCEVNIKDNITSNNWHLKIFSYNENNTYDLNQTNGWKNKSNIYIKDNVDTIQASLYTNWSIFTYKDNIDTWVFTWRNQVGFKKQLYINWKVFSKNTIWWWEQDENLKFTVVGWKKIKNSNTVFWEQAYIAAQAYDINFWRTSILEDDKKTYSTWNISDIIYNKYKCTWNKDNDTSKLCSASLIIEENNKK